MDAKTNLERLLEKEGVTQEELKAILKSSKKKEFKEEHLKLSDRHFKFGYLSDTHIGHKCFNEQLFMLAAKAFKKDKVDFVVHAGDHLEGMSGRPGHVYELTEVGFDQQIRKAEQLYKELQTPIYGIDGNHDDWYFKKGDLGVVVGNELAKRVKGYHNLGQGEGTLVPAKNVRVMLFHGNDGTAYADSYKLQKLLESFTGGPNKPNMVLSGHYHKSIYLFRRNIHGLECGTICGQTPWMRGKKIPAHMGFGIVDVYVDNTGVNKLQHTFVPYYEK